MVSHPEHSSSKTVMIEKKVKELTETNLNKFHIILLSDQASYICMADQCRQGLICEYRLILRFLHIPFSS